MPYCENFAITSGANVGVCKVHTKNQPNKYSSVQKVSNIYKNVKDEYYILREKLKKIQEIETAKEALKRT